MFTNYALTLGCHLSYCSCNLLPIASIAFCGFKDKGSELRNKNKMFITNFIN